MNLSHLKKRAMRADQKEVRRQAILASAWELFQGTSYEKVTMVDVANATGLAKGTLFLYFKTKEALFLSLTEQHIELFFTSIDHRLTALGQIDRSIPQVATILCEEVVQRPHLSRLLAILHIMLERNVEFDIALNFKYGLKKRFLQTGTLLELCLPFLAADQGVHVLMQCYAFVIGLWHLSDSSPIVQEVLQDPELQLFKIHFAIELFDSILTLLYGLERIVSEKRLD